MTVKYIHRGITLYVSCTINSSQIQGQAAANHCGPSHSTDGCPTGIPWQPGRASGLPQCQPPNWGASFKGKKSSVLKCWLHFVCLLDFLLFLNTSARNSFALLFPAHHWLSIIAWCEHFQYSFFLLAKYSNRGKGNRLTLVAVSLCLRFFAEWGNDASFFCHFLPRRVELPLYAEKKETHRHFPFCHQWIVILQCKSLNLFPS